ncbi:hypothetical protein JFN88_10555 [Paenibacillus sp. MAHUQ-46]|uniref:Uncharacterized protein n=1 Tax=Paenibacillus roseus TaxID=2798579 RepID=A0A934J7D6_9BACL|nr:hypothetical protein [Paenibacillus roseus]MBJ6361730.1 hypothetical protein [Paenibacillus roseus]
MSKSQRKILIRDIINKRYPIKFLFMGQNRVKVLIFTTSAVLSTTLSLHGSIEQSVQQFSQLEWLNVEECQQILSKYKQLPAEMVQRAQAVFNALIEELKKTVTNEAQRRPYDPFQDKRIFPGLVEDACPNNPVVLVKHIADLGRSLQVYPDPTIPPQPEGQVLVENISNVINEASSSSINREVSTPTSSRIRSRDIAFGDENVEINSEDEVTPKKQRISSNVSTPNAPGPIAPLGLEIREELELSEELKYAKRRLHEEAIKCRAEAEKYRASAFGENSLPRNDA